MTRQRTATLKRPTPRKRLSARRPTGVATTVVSVHTKTMELGQGTALSTASPNAFFARWIEHDTWPQWSPDTKWVRVQGPVAVGARGVLKPKGAPKVKFMISACNPDREYTDTSLLPGARLVFQHTVIPDGAGSRLHVRITMSGRLSFLWAKIIGGGFRESAQSDLDRLIELVEQEP